MKKLTVNGSWTQFIEPLRELKAFKTHGSLFGAPGSLIFNTPGHLPQAAWKAVRRPTVDYVVYSYATPIAWHDSVMGWEMPQETYSVSTSKQQGRIRAALSVIDNPAY